VWCTLVVLPACHRWWTRALAIAYPIVTLLVVVVTANHFVLDAVGGLLILAGGYAIARPLTNLVHARRMQRAVA
jgi:hypothetical protein